MGFDSGLAFQVLIGLVLMGVLALFQGWVGGPIAIAQTPRNAELLAASFPAPECSSGLGWIAVAIAFALGGLAHYGLVSWQRNRRFRQRCPQDTPPSIPLFPIPDRVRPNEPTPITPMPQIPLAVIVDQAIAALASFKLTSPDSWICQYRSAGCERVFGYSAAEMIADPSLWQRCLVPEDWQAWRRLQQQIAAQVQAEISTPAGGHSREGDRGGDPSFEYQIEYRFRHRDGSLRWILETLSVYQEDRRDRSDPPQAWFVTALSIDITQRKQTEATLLENEERFRSIFESAGIGVMLTGTNRIPMQTNPAVQALLGYSDAELCQMPFTQYTHPDDIALDVTLNEELIAGQRTSYQIEKRYIHKQGSLIWARLTVSAVRGATGDVQFTLAMIQDITAQRQAEAQLQAANAEMRALFAAMNDLIFVYDRNGRNLRTLSANERLLYRSVEEKTGKTLHEIFSPNLADKFLGYIHQALNTQQTVRAEYCLPIAGEEVWSDAVLSPIDSNTVIWAIRDITQRKKFEAALLERERYLAALVEVQQYLLDLEDNQPDPHQPILELLGRVSGASRAYIFENHLNSAGELLTSQRSEWCADGVSPQIENPDLQNMPVARVIPHWTELFSRGEVVAGNISSFPDAERSILEPQEIKSILLLPLMVNGQWFGLIGFDNCYEEKVWDASEIYLLQAAAAAIALSYERRLVNRELRTTNAELNALFNAMDELILVLDAEGRHLKVRGANFQLLYKPYEERLGRTLHEIFPQAQADWFLQQVHTVLQTKQTVHVEYSLTLEHGEEVWSDASISYIDANTVIWAVRDITERKRAEEVIRQSEARFQRLAANLPGIIYRYLLRADGSEAMTYVSPASQSVYELSPEAIQDDLSLVWQMIHPDDRPQLQAAIAESATTLQPFFWEGRIITPSGQMKWIRNNSRPERQENGDIIWDGLTIDVSDRKQAEEALKASETRFRSLVSNIPGAVFRCRIDQHWTLLYISNGVKDLLGYDAESLIENREYTFASLEHPDDVAMIRQVTMAAVLEQRPYSLEYRCIHTDGSIRWVMERAQPLVNDQGEVLLDGILIDITARKRVEEALQHSEDRFRSLVSNIPGVVYRCLYDHDWTMLFISDAIAQLAGYPPSDFIQNQVRSFASIIHPDDLAATLQESFAAFQQQQIYQLEYRILHADGSVRWVYDRGQGVIDAEGQVCWCDGAIFDVSDRKQAEFALQRQAERERLMTQVTQRIRQTLDLEEILVTTVAEVRQFLQADRVLIYQFNPDWSGHFVAESVAPGWTPVLPLAPGEQQFYQSTVDQDTCRVQQQAKRCDRSTPRSLENYIKDTYLQQHQGGSYATGMSYFCVEDIYQQGFSDCYLQLLERFQAKAYITVPIFQNTIHGHILWGLMGTYQNTGTRSWQEDEIKFVVNIATQLGVALQQAELLAQTLQQSTELKYAKEAADAANRAKSLFLASMSHELRTPLNAILGFTQLMVNDQNMTPSQQENLTIINRSGEHLLGLINDVLDMSKIEAGKIDLVEKQVDLDDLLNGLYETFYFRANAKGIALILERSPHLPRYIQIDDGKLRQILSNLLSNAIKFTEVGQVRFTVGTLDREPLWKGAIASEPAPVEDKDDRNGSQEPHTDHASASLQSITTLFFSIEDTGPGMAKAELDTLFTPFVQTETGLRSQQGTGLGLSIAKRLVQFLGGEIGVQSELGRGTLFWVKLPVKLAPSCDLLPADLGRAVIALAPGQPTYRILVVDDARTNRLLLLRLLEPLGFEVREAADGEEAIAQWEQWQPHLIWMDMQMPGLDGYAATRQIRMLEQARQNRDFSAKITVANWHDSYSSPPATIIIALTANAIAEERAQILATGCNDILNKPFRRQALLQKIADHLGVSYIYADEQPKAVASNLLGQDKGDPPITPHSLLAIANRETLPPGWLDQVYQAATQANARQLLQLAEMLPSHHEDLRRVIVNLVQQYRFDVIMDSARQVV